MTRRAVLTLEFRSWWLSGTGGGRGRLLDAACCRDADGLPAMPMTQVKGALRETADRLAAAGRAGWSGEKVARLFGGRAEDDGRSSAGAVAFLGDARLPEADRAGLVGNAARERRGMLYRRIAATAVDERGAARDRTLRYVEAAAPIALEGRLEWTAAGSPDADWVALLDTAAAATAAFGKAKADGYGAALARVAPAGEVPAKPAPTGVSPELRRAFRARLRLTQTRPAIFGVRAATEGAHKTHPAPTGGALLGWAAGSYADFADPFAVFHGGVRFGAAAPLAPDGSVCAPMPKLFMAPKHDPGGGIRDGRIDTEKVRIGHPATTDGATQIQYAPVDKKVPFLSPKGFAVNPARGRRLRTATEAGRAAENRLFGYEHLSADEKPEFVAFVERDAAVSDDDWERLMAAFDGRMLRLGRARGTSYGGEFECRAETVEEETETVPKGVHRLRVLAVSDLALADEFGAPCVAPDHAMLDLPPARFVGAATARCRCAAGRRGTQSWKRATWSGRLSRRAAS